MEGLGTLIIMTVMAAIIMWVIEDPAGDAFVGMVITFIAITIVIMWLSFLWNLIGSIGFRNFFFLIILGGILFILLRDNKKNLKKILKGGK